MELQLQVPRNVEAEMAVLGSIILDETLVVEIMDELSVDDFFDSRNLMTKKDETACDMIVARAAP